MDRDNSERQGNARAAEQDALVAELVARQQGPAMNDRAARIEAEAAARRARAEARVAAHPRLKMLRRAVVGEGQLRDMLTEYEKGVAAVRGDRGLTEEGKKPRLAKLESDLAVKLANVREVIAREASYMVGDFRPAAGRPVSPSEAADGQMFLTALPHLAPETAMQRVRERVDRGDPVAGLALDVLERQLHAPAQWWKAHVGELEAELRLARAALTNEDALAASLAETTAAELRRGFDYVANSVRRYGQGGATGLPTVPGGAAEVIRVLFTVGALPEFDSE